ncbi:RsbRD N-terminal domain-containing protein [Desulfatitalea alkaliphila]|uniref:RsbRD N-terminal domain-containing protein n=1 Tax=Desulfatitalea alkaliphila TaxID=2929485 RepID=A0AA41UHY5_9BACT|nr:RsbRD N-terminal domain-containing protein [Desulfatitalea alkaliphila]MCJ8499092.1 RsbRD N-terminal domain-containing protein [Desulfatitalea alkaliphila]
MGLMAQLALRKDVVVDKWFARVVDTYPAETARFLRSQKDPFANPVGRTTHQQLGTLVALLDADWNPDTARSALDPIMRIRAVQDFSAARATGFVFDLKQVIRGLMKSPDDARWIGDLKQLDRLIDEMALISFDLFMGCREKVYELKANEMKDRTYKAFAKAGLIKEVDDE